jgi:hypothetical protein
MTYLRGHAVKQRKQRQYNTDATKSERVRFQKQYNDDVVLMMTILFPY